MVLQHRQGDRWYCNIGRGTGGVLQYRQGDRWYCNTGRGIDGTATQAGG